MEKWTLILVIHFFIFWCYSDVDSTLLVYIASSCPNLEVLEISKSDTAVNWITGYGSYSFVLPKSDTAICA